jgi:hypothetical protein
MSYVAFLGNEVDRPGYDTTNAVFCSLLSDATLQFVYDYWLLKFRFDQPPAQSDIDPIELSSVLPNIYMVEHTENRGTIIQRAGPKLTEYYGSDVNNKSLSEIFEPNVLKCYYDMGPKFMKSIRPLHEIFQINQRSRDHIQVQTVILPLSVSESQNRVDLACMVRNRSTEAEIRSHIESFKSDSVFQSQN